MARWSREQRAQAVARVRAGESANAVAIDIGAAHSTVVRWIEAAESAETPSEKALAETVEEITEQLKLKQEQVRSKILSRIEALIPKSDDLRGLATAYGIITDKQLLAAGKPTSIHAQGLAIPDDVEAAQLEAAADELHRRRQEVEA